MSSQQEKWPLQPPKSIIVRMPNWLGDLVMATPVLADLRRKWPSAKITAMCQSGAAPLLNHDPHIDAVMSFSKPKGWIDRKQHHTIIDPIKKGKFDLGVLLTNSFSSAWWFWRGEVKNTIGFSSNLRDMFLNKSVPFPKNKETQHLVGTYKALLEPIGIPISKTDPELYISEEENKRAVELLNRYNVSLEKHTLIGINPGAAYGSAKCWLPERFKEVTRKLTENPNTYVVYFGDPNGAPLVNEICADFHDRVINLAAKTSIRELIALINCCTVFLTNDSGPMHIAAALKKPLLALFGSTNEVKTGPFPEGKVIHKHVKCSPCYKRTCPIDFRCMTRITVDEVCHELTKMLP